MKRKPFLFVLCIIIIVLLSICAVFSIMTAIGEGINLSNGLKILRDICMVGVFGFILRKLRIETK